jgi:hypothetical protein
MACWTSHGRSNIHRFGREPDRETGPSASVTQAEPARRRPAYCLS